MNLQVQTPIQARPRPPKRVRHYVVAFKCPSCDRYGYLDDFSGEKETRCGCGQQILVEVDQ